MKNNTLTPSRFSKILKLYIEAKGLSTNEFAEDVVGVSVSSIEKYLSSETRYPKQNGHLFVQAGVCSKQQLKLCHMDEVESEKGYKIQRLSEFLDGGGDFQKVSESVTKMLNYYEVPDCDENEWGSDEKWERIHRECPDTLFLLFHNNQEIIGYFHFVIINENLYKEIIAGENVNKTIETHDILPITQDITGNSIEYDIYIVDFFILSSHATYSANILLLYVIDYLYHLALQDIYIKRMVTNVTTTKAKILCINHGFEFRNKHKLHKVFSKDLKTDESNKNEPNKQIPSELYELDFKTKYDSRLFSDHYAINSLYKNHF